MQCPYACDCGSPTLFKNHLHLCTHQHDPEAVVRTTPAIAQLVEHLTVDLCSNQMVPGSIPGGRIIFTW